MKSARGDVGGAAERHSICESDRKVRLWGHAVMLTGVALAALAAAGGCGATTTSNDLYAGDGAAPAADGSGEIDSGVSPPVESDAGGGVDAGGGGDGGGSSVDGTAVRKACTNTLGSALTTRYGRLDGRLVAIVPPGHSGCNADTTHVHLQVESGAATYDIAVNVDGLMAQTDHAVVGGAWQDGWHTNNVALDYPTALGLHSAAFATTNAAALEGDLAKVNHISVFATGYGPSGAHLVHRNSGGRDGALVLNPLGPTPHFIAFRFATDTF